MFQNRVLRKVLGTRGVNNGRLEAMVPSSAMRLALLTRYWGEQILEVEMGGACSMYGGEEKFMHGCGGGKPE